VPGCVKSSGSLSSVSFATPKVLLIAAGILLIGVVAFLIGRSTNPTAERGGKLDSSSSGAELANLKCSDTEGLQSVERFLKQKGEDGPELLDSETGKLGDWVWSELVGCGDIDGDGSAEMALSADAVKAGGSHPVSWFLLKQDAGEWQVVLRRTVPVPRLRFEGSTLTESTPGYRPQAALGDPSYRRTGAVAFEGGAFSYRPNRLGNASLLISVSPDSNIAEQVGPIPTQSALPSDAIAALGRPSSTSASASESCPMTWSDLGLEIFFANLGGLNACKFGRVAGFALQGSAAETSGWIGPRGARIGMSRSQIASRFPGIYRDESTYQAPGEPKAWAGWVLIEGPTPYGDDQLIPTVTGYFDRNRLRRLNFYVGAAGE